MNEHITLPPAAKDTVHEIAAATRKIELLTQSMSATATTMARARIAAGELIALAHRLLEETA